MEHSHGENDGADIEKQKLRVWSLKAPATSPHCPNIHTCCTNFSPRIPLYVVDFHESNYLNSHMTFEELSLPWPQTHAFA